MCNAHEGIYEYGKEEGVKIGLLEGEEIGLVKGKEIGLAKGKEIGLAKGKEIGLVKGEEIGLTKGKTLEKRSIAKRMLKLGVALEIITMITGLTYPEVMDLKH